jgi:hypothetical protein
MNMLGPWQAASLLSLLMALGGCFYVLYGVGTIVKRLANSSGRPLSGGFKFSKIATGSISLSTGRTRLAPMALTVVCCLALITVPVTIALAKYFSRYPTYELREVHVDRQLTEADTGKPGFSYWMTYSSESAGHIHFLATFCGDYTPQFQAGSTLSLLRYEDRGSCWGLTNEHAGYLIERSADGKPIKTR